jgi:hypothetical protein
MNILNFYCGNSRSFESRDVLWPWISPILWTKTFGEAIIPFLELGPDLCCHAHRTKGNDGLAVMADGDDSLWQECASR